MAVSTRMWTGYAVVTATETSISDSRRPQWSLRGEWDKHGSLLCGLYLSISSLLRHQSEGTAALPFLSSLPQNTGRTSGNICKHSADGRASRCQPVNGHYHCHWDNPHSTENNPQTIFSHGIVITQHCYRTCLQLEPAKELKSYWLRLGRWLSQ